MNSHLNDGTSRILLVKRACGCISAVGVLDESTTKMLIEAITAGDMATSITLDEWRKLEPKEFCFGGQCKHTEQPVEVHA